MKKDIFNVKIQSGIDHVCISWLWCIFWFWKRDRQLVYQTELILEEALSGEHERLFIPLFCTKVLHREDAGIGIWRKQTHSFHGKIHTYPHGPLFFVHVLIWCICAWYEWPFWNNIYGDIQICMLFGEIWQVKVFHISARIHLRGDYSFAQWPLLLASGHCMSPSWWGWWPPAVHTPSTHSTWQGRVVSVGLACTYPLPQSSAATWGQVGFSLSRLIASQNIFFHQIVTKVLSLYPKPPRGKRSNA